MFQLKKLQASLLLMLITTTTHTQTNHTITTMTTIIATTTTQKPIRLWSFFNGNTSSKHNATELDAGAAPISDILRLPEALDADRVLEESSRHFFCIPLLRIFNLELTRPLKVGEHIGLTGSHRRLGEWQLERSLEMRALDGGKRMEWLAKVPICANERIAYRYFIYTLDDQRNRRIRVWEGQQQPRVMESYQIYRQPGVDYFGDTTYPALDLGGREGMWLRHERLIELKFIWQRQLRFERQQQQPHRKKQQQPRSLRIKLSLLGQSCSFGSTTTTMTTTTTTNTLLEVARYAYNNSKFREQPSNGVVYNYEGRGDVIIFRIFETLRLRHSYKLCFFNTKSQILLAESVIWNIDLKGSEGILQLPVHSTKIGFEIGRLTLPYLIVKPLPQAELLDLKGSYQHFWPLNWPTMHVGNRGAGQSFYADQAPYVENTIKSFLHIHKLKGEMVTIDVQLTKDYVPIVWHEFGFYTAPHNRVVQSLLDLDYVLIQHLTYNELRQRRVFVLKTPSEGLQELTYLNKSREKLLMRIFPKLAAVFRSLPKSLGLIINIKWSQLLRYGQTESGYSNLIDKNRYVDTLIATTALWGCGRPLIYASFDADICSMLRYKQNIYPTIFMSVGRERNWQQPFKDLRTRTYTNAVNFAQSEQLLGTALHVGNFLETPQLLELGRHLLQANFLWGEELRDAEIVRKFQNLEVTGLIYDRLDLHRPFQQRFEFFGAKELREIFERSCSSALRNASAGIETKGGSKTRRKIVKIHLQI